jgi:hypothetical protein
MGKVMGPKNTQNLYGKTMQEHLEQHLLYLEPCMYTHMNVCVHVHAHECTTHTTHTHTHSVQHKIAKDASLLGCDAASLGEWPPTVSKECIAFILMGHMGH